MAGFVDAKDCKMRKPSTASSAEMAKREGAGRERSVCDGRLDGMTCATAEEDGLQ